MPLPKEVEFCITYAHEDNKDKAIKMIKEFCEKQEKSTVIGGLHDTEYAETIKQLDSSEVNVKKYYLRYQDDKGVL